MKAASGVALCVVLASAAAMADTFYRYHDKTTGRDVFVNQLEQVPQKYRSEAKIVLENAASANQEEARQAESQAPAHEGLTDKLIKELTPAVAPATEATGFPRANKNLLGKAPAAAAAAVDTRLVKAGARPLTVVERAELTRFLMMGIYLGMVAGLGALVVWVVLIVCAFRDKHPAWGALMILLYPVAYLYLTLHFAKGRPLLKTLSALGLLSPALAGLWTAWQFHTWLRVVVAVRGGHL